MKTSLARILLIAAFWDPEQRIQLSQGWTCEHGNCEITNMHGEATKCVLICYAAMEKCKDVKYLTQDPAELVELDIQPKSPNPKAHVHQGHDLPSSSWMVLLRLF